MTHHQTSNDVACIATIIQWCFTHRYTVMIILVVCLLGRLRVCRFSLVWHVRIVTLGGGGAGSFLGRPRTIPSCASHSRPFTLSRNPASCRRDGSNRRIVPENTRPPKRENDVFVRPITSTNPKHPVMNTASPLCQRFPSCRPRCVGFGTLTRTISAKSTTS